MQGDRSFAEVSKRLPFTKWHPRVGAFFKAYFAREKVIPFGNRFVVVSNFPPYPSAAFDNLAEQVFWTVPSGLITAGMVVPDIAGFVMTGGGLRASVSPSQRWR